MESNNIPNLRINRLSGNLFVCLLYGIYIFAKINVEYIYSIFKSKYIYYIYYLLKVFV